MDFAYFLRLLLDRKWLILLVTVVATAAAYFATKQGSVVYRAKSLIATGITENTTPAAGAEQATSLRPWEAEQQFSNLIEIINSRSVIGILSQKLVLHDLTSDRPFRDLEALRARYSEEELEHAIELFETKFNQQDFSTAFAAGAEEFIEQAYADSMLLSEPVPKPAGSHNADFGDSEDDRLMKDILRTLRYDYNSIQKDLRTYRVRQTDFLMFAWFSENRYLSAWGANTAAQEFIRYYSKVQAERSDASVDFFTQLAFEKKAELDRKNEALKQYKLDNNIINIDDQSTSRIAQIGELELRRQEESKTIPANRNAISAIDRQLSSAETAAGAVQANNQRVQNLRDEMANLTSQSVAAQAQGLDNSSYENQLATKRAEMTELLTSIANSDPNLSAGTAELLATKLDLEIEMEIAKASVRSIDGELGRLRGSVVQFVQGDAEIQAMEREISVAQDEYLDIVGKLNMAKLMSLTSSNKLALRELAEVPDHPEPSKTLFLSAFAGALAFIFCVVVIFGLAYLDMTLKTPDRFRRMTGVPLIGYLNRLKFSNLDLETFFNQRSHDPDLETFKQLLRKVRFQLEQHNAKRVLVTSTKESEGKTFLIISLAYSLSLNNKKILIIDTNFKNNTLTQMLSSMQQENLLSNTKLIGDAELDDEFYTSRPISRTNHSGIDIIGSKGGYNSPSEIFAGKNFNKLLDQLELTYDYIFLEGSSMNDFSDTQELVDYADHVIAVFSADSEIKPPDKQSIEFLKALEDKLLGGVLNRVELKNTA